MNARLDSLAPNGHDVRAGPEHRRFSLHLLNCREQTLTLKRIAPQPIEIAGEPARPFDGQDFQDLKTSGQKFTRQLPGTMKKSVGEIDGIRGRIAMLTLFQIAV